MALAKFNVFHWHLVDDDSFPMEFPDYPNLSKNSAFSAKEIYSQQDLKDIVDYAGRLGIRVIPEFDNPGHTRALGMDPDLLPMVLCYNREWPYSVPDAYTITAGPPTGVLDPSKDLTYTFLEKLFKYFNTIFPDPMVHLGGDEVFSTCYK